MSGGDRVESPLASCWEEAWGELLMRSFLFCLETAKIHKLPDTSMHTLLEYFKIRVHGKSLPFIGRSCKSAIVSGFLFASCHW